jgi:hypothetical protein
MKTHAIPDTLHCCPTCHSGLASGMDENGQPTVCEECEWRRGQDAPSNCRSGAKALFLGMAIGVLGSFLAVMIVWLYMQ